MRENERVLSIPAAHNPARFHENCFFTFCIILLKANKQTVVGDYIASTAKITTKKYSHSSNLIQFCVTFQC